MGEVVKGKKEAISMGMAGRKIAGKSTVKVADSGLTFCTPLQPGNRLGRIINRLAVNRLSRTA